MIFPLIVTLTFLLSNATDITEIVQIVIKLLCRLQMTLKTTQSPIQSLQSYVQ